MATTPTQDLNVDRQYLLSAIEKVRYDIRISRDEPDCIPVLGQHIGFLSGADSKRLSSTIADLWDEEDFEHFHGVSEVEKELEETSLKELVAASYERIEDALIELQSVNIDWNISDRLKDALRELTYCRAYLDQLVEVSL